MMTTPTSKTLTVEEAAKVLQIGRNAAYEAVARGELPHIRIGKRILILAVPLERMLAGEGTGHEAKAA